MFQRKRNRLQSSGSIVNAYKDSRWECIWFQFGCVSCRLSSVALAVGCGLRVGLFVPNRAGAHGENIFDGRRNLFELPERNGVDGNPREKIFAISSTAKQLI